MYTRDTHYRGAPESEEVFRCVCGIGLESPTSRTLPRELAVPAAVKFFQTGELPRCGYWDLEATTTPGNHAPPQPRALPASGDDIPF